MTNPRTRARRSAALLAAAVLLGVQAAQAAPSALLIANSDYEPKCDVDLPTVPGDVALTAGALMAAMFVTTTVADRNGIEMMTDVESNVPPAPDRYVVVYAGHSEPAVTGAPLVGPDCTRMSPADLMGVLADDAARTLLVLDACASGTFADAANAIDDRICTIASTTGDECGEPGVFLPCFAQGLNGDADANQDGAVTVAEAAAWAIANCGANGTVPTWDGDCPDVPIGMTPVSVDGSSWGAVKAEYR